MMLMINILLQKQNRKKQTVALAILFTGQILNLLRLQQKNISINQLIMQPGKIQMLT